MTRKSQVVICGAGIMGVSAAYFLARAGVRDILLIDERAPLTLTSVHSTECYRNWWPDPEMLALMNRSIDLMESFAVQNGNKFHLNRRGYLYVTADESKIPGLKARSLKISRAGGGPLRSHALDSSSYRLAASEGFHDEPDGADLLIGTELIRTYYPFITEQAVAALHVRRAGWMSAQQLGMSLLDECRLLGVQFESARVAGVDIAGNRVRGISLSSREKVECEVFVNAAGPYLKSIGLMLGLAIPVQTELHLKVVFNDHLGVVGRDAPMLIWDDPQMLPWDVSESADLSSDPETRWLTQPFPAGAHTRPEGGGDSQTILLLWDYKDQNIDPVFPLPMDEQYPEVALRGLSTMLPGIRAYFGHAARPAIDGGYYVKTRENRLLAGPLSVDGAFVIGAASGYGIMSACASGELLAAHVVGAKLPPYAPAFSLERYQDSNYLKQLENWGESGQL